MAADKRFSYAEFKANKRYGRAPETESSAPERSWRRKTQKKQDDYYDEAAYDAYEGDYDDDYYYDDYYDDEYDGEYGDDRYREKRGRWWIAPMVVLIVLFIIGIVGYVMYGSYKTSLTPVDPKSVELVEFTIEKGATTDDIANALEDKGLTRNAMFFKIHSKFAGNDGRYREGIYELSKSMSMDSMMQLLIGGTQNTNIIKFTIPEGLTTKQTIKILAETGLATEEELMNEVKNGVFDYKFLEDTPAGSENRLEGFLYPKTYEVYKQATAHDAIDVMLKQFDKEFTQEFSDQAKKDNCTVYEIVTIASMIERETSVEAEKSVIARVIYNRLKKDMKLQIDATVQYALPEVKKNLTYDDLKVESPYNTYLHKGLPPGPICSPSISSIKGALWPDTNEYLYYVLKPALDGTHNFAKTDSEFEKYKKEYKDANSGS
ncbi:MAG: endolytic transglycosylase MltG [Clostridiales Family XIII bacterium]|jgi:UPF0755 protein|nr:endolytic transglycosylase MltG [Clostridiales Family XIII bacterium]